MPKSEVELEVSKSCEDTTQDVELQAGQQTETANDPPRYHVLTKKQKWPLVLLVAAAGIFSPMSANIFFSAITAVAQDLDTTIQRINLSVTAYMVAQGVCPSFWSAICDVRGRRPVLLMTFAVYIGASAGLAVTKTYPLLVGLRVLQAAGSAAVNSIGGGLIGDIADRSERGGFMGVYQLGPQLGPTLGPVLGGLLTDAFGWQSIFAFLASFAGVVFLLMILVLPETLRSLVGNGSVPPPAMNMSLLYWWTHKDNSLSAEALYQNKIMPPAKTWKDIDWLASIKIFRNPDISLILSFNAICYTLFYTVITSNGNVLQSRYSLNETEIGLTYLAFGGGCISAAILNTRRLDGDYRRSLRKDIAAGRIPPDAFTNKAVNLDDMLGMRVEYARLHTLYFYYALIFGSVIAYGWTVEKRVHIAGPLVLQFLIGLASTTITNSNTTLLVDLCRQQSASAVAAMNLSRCLLGAAGTAVIDPILARLGPGMTYTSVSLLSLLAVPLLFLEIKLGPRCRATRSQRALRP